MRTRALFAFLIAAHLCTSAGCSDSGDAADAAIDASRDDASDDTNTCEARVERASDALIETIEGASVSCSRASDCVNVPISTQCHDACTALVATASVPDIEAAIAAQDTTTCADFEADGCERIVPPCVPPPPIACVDQRCTVADGAPIDDAGQMMDASTEADAAEPNDAGDDCLASTITLGSDGGLVSSRMRFVLEPCRTFRAEESGPDDEPIATCSNEIGPGGAVTVEDLNARLAHADVQAAIAEAPVLFGVDRRPVDGPLTVLQIDDARIEIGLPCGADSCRDIPEGIEALRMTIQELVAQQEAASPSCPEP